VGAGTGGTTRAAFRAIGEYAKQRGSVADRVHYTYTDISAGFFKEAKARFKDFASMMTFQKLDMETLPSKQNFKVGTYDLIIASQCLHATKNMTRTMEHARELLRPGGKV
ncbi:S-adenosyl-L-methionine-dependent methyltransferase, partial [Mytilinidion resinicola]